MLYKYHDWKNTTGSEHFGIFCAQIAIHCSFHQQNLIKRNKEGWSTWPQISSLYIIGIKLAWTTFKLSSPVCRKGWLIKYLNNSDIISHISVQRIYFCLCIKCVFIFGYLNCTINGGDFRCKHLLPFLPLCWNFSCGKPWVVFNLICIIYKLSFMLVVPYILC
jgi:hypothetical protein